MNLYNASENENLKVVFLPKTGKFILFEFLLFFKTTFKMNCEFYVGVDIAHSQFLVPYGKVVAMDLNFHSG
jgi:hypothetical protein